MEKIAHHDGIVTEVIAHPLGQTGTVRVKVHVVSACGSCKAHGHCGFADSKDKIMDIDTPQYQQYHTGEPVNVVINASRGLQAVFIAYILPALLLLATLVTLTTLHLSEGWVALATLLVVALYGGILYICRHRLQRKYTMALSKK